MFVGMSQENPSGVSLSLQRPLRRLCTIRKCRKESKESEECERENKSRIIPSERLTQQRKEEGKSLVCRFLMSRLKEQEKEQDQKGAKRKAKKIRNERKKYIEGIQDRNRPDIIPAGIPQIAPNNKIASNPILVVGFF